MNDIHGLKQAQEALRASEAELRLIMDNVPARVAYIDRDYRFRFLNRHNEEWLSESRKELTGRRIGEVVGEARGRQLQPLLTRCARRRDDLDRAAARAAQRRAALGVDPLRAQPRRRGQRDRHLRGAHRHPRPEAQRGSAAPRELDALVAHQQHAARGAGMGSRFPPRALVAAGRAHLRLARRGSARACRSRAASSRTKPTARRWSS